MKSIREDKPDLDLSCKEKEKSSKGDDPPDNVKNDHLTPIQLNHTAGHDDCNIITTQLDNFDALAKEPTESQVDGLKKARRTKSDYQHKSFLCTICGKAYYSYPALYTHKRNKHNVIPITGKQTIFKKSMNKYKFKYSAIESSLKNNELKDELLNTYKEKLIKLYTDPGCILYTDNFSPETNTGFRRLQMFSYTTQLELKEMIRNAKIDDALTIYLFSFMEVVERDFFIDITTTYCILLRTYLNAIGWDYKRKFIRASVNIDFDYKGSFCEYNDCKEIPDLINEFISVFMHMDEKFHIEETYLLDITRNFCNWLFVNNLTNFKLFPNEIPGFEDSIVN
jgi:hypothetical protein